MNYWLVKSEPHKYSWDQFEKDGQTFWDGVRNFQARNSLKAMQLNDQVLFYHSNDGKQIVGLAQIITEAYPDPTATEGDWVAVDLQPLQKFPEPVSLSQIKTHPELYQMGLIRQSRLSVMPVTVTEFKIILELGGIKKSP